MIFKTFNNDIDKISAKWGMFGRSFNDIGTAIVGRINDITKAFQATDDLVGSIKNSDSIWKRLYPSKNDIESLKVTVPDLIDTNKAKEHVETLKQIDAGIHPVFKSYQDWHDELNDGEKWIAQYAQETQGQIRTQDDLVRANKAARASALAQNEALKAQTLSAKAGKAALSALTTALNMAAFALISKGIELVVTTIDNYIHRVEKANEAMNEAASEYTSAKSSLESVTSELQEQNQKLDDLLAKDKLTYAEKGQLEELQSITKELLLQQDIEEKRAALASKEAAGKAVDAYEKQYGTYDTTEEALEEKLSYDTFPMPEGEDDVTGNIAAYLRAQQSIKQLEKEYNDAEKEGKDTAYLSKIHKRNVDIAGEYSDALDSNISDLQAKRTILEDEYKKAVEKRDSGVEPLESSEQKVIETYESINELIKMVYEYTDPNTWKSMQIENVFDTEGIEKTKEELIEMAKEGTLDESTIQSYAKLSDALEQNGVSASELCNELNALAEEDALNMQPFTSFEDAWASSFTSKDEDIKQLGSRLLALAEQGRLTADTFKETDSTRYFKNFGISAEEAVLKINRLADSSKQLSAMSGGLSSITGALADKKENNFVSADTLAGFDAEIRGLESWDRFQTVLGSTASSYNDCEEAASALATEWMNSSDFLAQLTDENREYYEAQLQAMNVENYEEILDYYQTLNEAKEALAEVDLINTSQSELEALIGNGEYYGLTADLIWGLYDAKIAQQAASIDTSADCTNLLALAGDAEKTCRSLELLNQLKKIYSGFESGAYNDNRVLREEAHEEVKRIQAELAQLANGEGENGEKTTKPNLKLSSGRSNTARSSASQAGREAADEYMEAFEKELKDLKELKDAGLLSEKAYLDSLRSLYERYFKDRQEYIKDYAKYEKEYLDGMKSLYDSVLSRLTSRFDDRTGAIGDERDAAVNALKAEKEAAESAYQAEIDAIEKKNQARQRELDLQQKKYNLERLLHQRTILLYSEEEGFHYTTDDSAISRAGEEVREAEDEIRIAELKEMIDKSNSYYDGLIGETEAYYDTLIRLIEEQKTQFEELQDLLSEAQMHSLLQELGINEDALLAGSGEEFARLRDAYIGILADLNAGNEGVLSALSQLSGMEALPSFLGETAGIASLDAAALSENGAVLSALSGFVDRFKEICSEIPGIWNSALAEAFTGSPQTASPAPSSTASSPSLPASADGSRYAALLAPMLTELDACSAQLEEKLNAYIGVWTQFRAGLAAIIGVGSTAAPAALSAGTDQGNASSAAAGSFPGSLSAQTGGGQEGNAAGIIGTLTEGGALINDALNGEYGWAAAFETVQGSIHDYAAAIVDCVESMVEEIVNACTEAAAAIGMTAAVSEGGAPALPTPYTRKGHADASMEGRAAYAGSGGLGRNEKKVLRSEFGQPELTVFPDGHYELTTEPVLSDLPKGAVIFNEEKTREILKESSGSHTSAYTPAAAQTLSHTPAPTPTPVPYVPDALAAIKAYEQQLALLNGIGGSMDAFNGSMMHARSSRINTAAQRLNASAPQNIQPLIKAGDIHVTCPGVTSSEVMKHLGDALNREFSGLSLDALQRSMMR